MEYKIAGLLMLHLMADNFMEPYATARAIGFGFVAMIILSWKLKSPEKE